MKSRCLVILNPKTPLRRIGFIVISLYFIWIMAFSFVWSATEKPLLYKSNPWGYIGDWNGEVSYKSPPKPIQKDGYGWMRDSIEKAWILTTEECDESKLEEKRKLLSNRIKKDRQTNSTTSKFDLSTAHIITFKELLSDIGMVCPSYKVILDKDNYIWESSLSDFLEEVSSYNKIFIVFLLGIAMYCGVGEIAISFVRKALFLGKKIYIWIKTGHWEVKKNTQLKKTRFTPKTRKAIKVSIVIIGWLASEIIIKNLGIIIGAAPYSLITLFWLWLLFKALGRSLWGLKKTHEE